MIMSEPGNPTLKKNELPIDAIGIKKAAGLIRAVNHPVRQAMLQIISRAGETTVTDLCLQLKLDQPTASSHLAVLRRAQVVTTRREGHRVVYAVCHNRLSVLHQKLEQFLG